MISIIRDPKIKLPKIEVPLYSESLENDPLDGSDNPKQQTKIDGIETPLIKINNITILFYNIKYLKLECKSIPEVTVEIDDNLGLVKTFDSPTNDNILQLQIIPPFDNTYKKINLTFFITSLNIADSYITIHAIYKIPNIYDSIMKSYGKLSSFSLFDKVSSDLQLGFASNIKESRDVRYIYNSNKNVIEFLNDTIRYSGYREHVYDYWIDWWNNINIIDLYNEYNLLEDDSNMQVWIPDRSGSRSDTSDSTQSIKTLAMVSNLPINKLNPLYVSDYKLVNNSSMETDLNFEVYSMNNLSNYSVLIEDGDIKNDIYKRYSYGGEVFGDFDYLTQRVCRNFYLNKIYSECVEISLNDVILGLVKGYKVNFIWYETNPIVNESLRDLNDSISSNIVLPGDVQLDESTIMRPNKSISGQYLILDCIIEYSGKWTQKLLISRPKNQKFNYSEITNEFK